MTYHFHVIRGTVPAGGERIFVIITKCRNDGIRMTIITGDGVVVIDIL